MIKNILNIQLKINLSLRNNKKGHNGIEKEVEKQGFLWGITDMKKAKENNGNYKLKALQGKYGKKVGE